ncbi:condensation domain-containing protein [Shewanella surugensis]|uniref:Condensation domain-containing protein n=1 Tax=Shewanella surugensis TaxID=212020 RepID=A0ABT0LJB6_9GAMM|nr:condensation domain-containing protein [Shewanella surugensis]MCL1127807.1 condensation domain-containing protein [Shewanella surugensis]
MNNKFNTLPMQLFYTQNIGEYEFNLARVLEVKPGYKISFEIISKALNKIADAQPYLRAVPSNSDKLAVKILSTNEAMSIEHKFIDSVGDNEIFSEINNLIETYSKKINNITGPTFIPIFCEGKNWQKFIILADHYVSDNGSAIIILGQLDEAIVNNTYTSLPDSKTIDYLNSFISETISSDHHGILKYWKKRTEYKSSRADNTIENERIVKTAMSDANAKETISFIKKYNITFDQLVISAFLYSYYRNVTDKIYGIQIYNDMRRRLNFKNIQKIVGWLGYSYPLFPKNLSSRNIIVQVKDIIENMHDSEKNGLEYCILSGNDSHKDLLTSMDAADIEYSNIGDFQKYMSRMHIFKDDEQFNGYYAAKTFSKDMPRYRDIFVRPFIFDGITYCSICYNSKQYGEVVMQKCCDETIANISIIIKEYILLQSKGLN